MLYVKAVLVMYVTYHGVSCSSTSILQPRHGCPLTSVVRPQVGKLAVVATTQQPSVTPAGTKLVTLRTTGKILPHIPYKMVPLLTVFRKVPVQNRFILIEDILLCFNAEIKT